MPTYTCILAYPTAEGRTRLWVRFYARRWYDVVLASAVPGHAGVPLRAHVKELAGRLLTRFDLQAHRLILLEHTLPEREGEGDEVSKVLLNWDGACFYHPRWQTLTPRDLAHLLGESVTLPPQVWYERPVRGWWGCEVGTRRALVHPADVDEWQAVVTQGNLTVIERGLASLDEAQGWALDRLAAWAAEFDLDWRGGGDR